jgi:lipopolysaccharide transport system ATP-binding protein
MEPAIKIENLSKQYRLGLVGTGTLSHDLKRWWHLIRGKEDPYLKIGESNDRSKKGNSEYVWALKDINLEVMPGEVLGIIGENRADKTTLLKIVSKVTDPSIDAITNKGRIGFLLEESTGSILRLLVAETIVLNLLLNMNE